MAQKYINDGYLVISEIFDQATVESIQAEIPKFRDGTYPVQDPFNQTSTDSGLLAVHFPHWVSRPIFETLDHPNIKEVLQIIVGKKCSSCSKSGISYSRPAWGIEVSLPLESLKSN